MGGKAFNNIRPIRNTDITTIISTVESLLWGREYCLVGSSNISKEMYGDLDIAVEMDADDWMFLKSRINQNYDTRLITKNTLSVNLGGQQVDLINSKSLDFASHMLRSWPSEYKSAHRNILLMTMIKVMTEKVSVQGDIQIRTRQHLDLNDGLVFLVQTKGKGSTGRYKTIDKVILSNDFISIIRKFLPETSVNDTKTFESVYNVMFKRFFVVQGSRDIMFNIMKETKEVLQSANLIIPRDIGLWVQ